MAKTAEEKKKKEIYCLRNAIRCSSPLGATAQEIYTLLQEGEKYIFEDCVDERPDIIMNTPSMLIGVEHCQADLLFWEKRGKAYSMASSQEDRTRKVVEKYKNLTLLDRDVESGEALFPAFDSIEERFSLQEAFDYRIFLCNFERVASQHNKNSGSYRANLSAKAPEKQQTLGCIIDVPYLKSSTYSFISGGVERLQRIKGIPLTSGIIDSISKMTGFDFVILYLRPIDGFIRKKDFICYYFKPKEMTEMICQQRIKIYDSFSFSAPLKVSFNRENIVSHQDKKTFSYTVSRSFPKPNRRQRRTKKK